MAKKATPKKAPAMAVEERPSKSLRDQIQDALVSEVVVDDKNLDREAFPELEKARDSYVATERNKRVAKIRAGGVAQAFTDRKAKDPELPVAVGLPNGQAVYLGHVQEIEGGVEVWLGEKNGEPTYRIFNPPTLARDPLGDIEVRGQKYREDPLGALAEVVAGQQQTEKKVRR